MILLLPVLLNAHHLISLLQELENAKTHAPLVTSATSRLDNVKLVQLVATLAMVSTATAANHNMSLYKRRNHAVKPVVYNFLTSSVKIVYLHVQLVPSCSMIWSLASVVVLSVLNVLNWLLIVPNVLDLFGIIIIVFRNVLIAIMLIGLIPANSVLVILMLVLNHL